MKELVVSFLEFFAVATIGSCENDANDARLRSKAGAESQGLKIEDSLARSQVRSSFLLTEKDVDEIVAQTQRVITVK